MEGRLGHAGSAAILRKIALYTALSLAAFLSMAPIIWIGLTALKSQRDALASPPVWSFVPQWGNFVEAWNSNDFGRSFLTTISVSLLSVAITLLTAIPAGYALARYRYGWLTALDVAMLMIRLMPEVLFMLPLYVLYQTYGLYDTQIGIALAFQIINLPYSAWLVRQFVTEVPVDLDEAAMLDGASPFTTLIRIIVPIITPGIVAAGVLSFISVWTNLLLPLTLTYSDTLMIPTTIANFKGYGSFNLPVMSAAALVSLVPQFLFFLFAQRYIVRGLTLGAVKG
jgi:multiple sugar transport system permease protein